MAFWNRKKKHERAERAGRPEQPAQSAEEVAMTLVIGDRRRDITVRELAVGNKLAADALLAVLAEKGLVDAADVKARIKQFGERDYRPGLPQDPAPEPDPEEGERS